MSESAVNPGVGKIGRLGDKLTPWRERDGEGGGHQFQFNPSIDKILSSCLIKWSHSEKENANIAFDEISAESIIISQEYCELQSTLQGRGNALEFSIK